MEGSSPTFLFRIGDQPIRLLVQRDHYTDGGGLAVLLFDQSNGEPFTVASINVEGLDLPDDEFVFKTYSENEGLMEAMLEAGIIEPTGRFTGIGPICRLLRSVKSTEDEVIVMEPAPSRDESGAGLGPVPSGYGK